MRRSEPPTRFQSERWLVDTSTEVRGKVLSVEQESELGAVLMEGVFVLSARACETQLPSQPVTMQSEPAL